MPNPFAPHYPGSTKYVGPALVLSDDDMDPTDTFQVVSAQVYYALDGVGSDTFYSPDRVRVGPVASEDAVHGAGPSTPGGTPSGDIAVPAGYLELHVITRTNVLPADGTRWGYVHLHPDTGPDQTDEITRPVNGMNYQDHAFLVDEGTAYTVWLSASATDGDGTPIGRRYLSEFYVEAIGPGPVIPPVITPPVTARPPVVRQYPRDDNLGLVGGGRVYPPPRRSRPVAGQA